MTIPKHHQTYILYAIAILLVGAGLFLWVRQGKDTNNDVDRANHIVSEIKMALDEHEQHTEADHDGQDALLTCMFNILAERQVITKVEVEGCVITTAVPPRISEGITPSDQAGSSSQSEGNQNTSQSLPSSNNTGSSPPAQPDSSQPPDNEGVIIDLPMLPPVHIPSPL